VAGCNAIGQRDSQAAVVAGGIAHAAQARQLSTPERLAIALRVLGRIERTLFILDWLQSVELRRRVHAGLNKGEARNALAGAVAATGTALGCQLGTGKYG
jgi:hypothetical protein